MAETRRWTYSTQTGELEPMLGNPIWDGNEEAIEARLAGEYPDDTPEHDKPGYCGHCYNAPCRGLPYCNGYGDEL